MIKWKKNDRGALVVCLVLAIALWVYVMNQVNPPMTREYQNIPVNLINTEALESDSLVVMEPEQPTITVTLTGLRNTLNRISASQIIAEADLQGYSEGSVRVPVTIKQPADTAVAQSSQRDVLFKIERMVERNIPATVEILGDTQEDYKYNFSFDPEMITINAPRSRANSVHAAVVKVDISEKNESFTSTLPVQLMDADNNEITNLTPKPELVSVSTEVRRVKEVPIVIAHTGTLPGNVTILQESIEPNVIRVVGPDALVSALENVRTEPIDYATMTESGQRNVQVQLPEGIRLDEEPNLTYSFTVRTPVEQSYLIDRSTIDIRNVTEELSASVEQGTSILVKLSGEENVINSLERSAVELFVDASGLGPGEHEVSVQIESIEGLTVDQEQLESVTLLIEENSTDE